MTFAIMKDVPYLPCYADLLEEGSAGVLEVATNSF